MNNVQALQRPFIIGIGGPTSEVGKTTLLCELLRAFPGWEAIKTTRGHYRSCGKDPHSCCVSDLLEENAIVRSGRDENYEPGKDTGRYWDAGAANVHWVIATDNQVDAGIREALSRVRAKGVLVEGNSFTEYLQPDYFVMVVRAGNDKIKATARKSLGRVSAYYVTDDVAAGNSQSLTVSERAPGNSGEIVPVFLQNELRELVLSISALTSSLAA